MHHVSFIGDAHCWPESYYLGSHQARQALSSVSVPRSLREYECRMNSVAPGLTGGCKSRRTDSRRSRQGCKRHIISYRESSLPPWAGGAYLGIGHVTVLLQRFS